MWRFSPHECLNLLLFHGPVIAQFAHFDTFNGTSIFSYGGHVPLYHWASYMLPAVVCSFSNSPSLVRFATSMWEGTRLYRYGFRCVGIGGDSRRPWIGGYGCGRRCIVRTECCALWTPEPVTSTFIGFYKFRLD